MSETEDFNFAEVDDLGQIKQDKTAIDKHIKSVIAHPLIDLSAIKAARFSAVVDGVNSTGGIVIPTLLNALEVDCFRHCIVTQQDIFHTTQNPLKSIWAIYLKR